MPDVTSRLREITAKGDPAHQQKAQLLLDALADDADDPTTLSDAALLIDAYLNDPYLTR